MAAANHEPIRIIGQGLAGTCLAWELWRRNVEFRVVDREQGGSSRVAAGVINPVTGKNFCASWRVGEFLPEALGFYQSVEVALGRSIWHPMPIVRLASSAMEWEKIVSKLADPAISRWIGRVLDPPRGWVGAIEVVGGGRLDTRTFLEASREFFLTSGRYHNQCATPAGARDIVCTGAAALLAGLHGAHRSAKGEILTLEAPDWDDSRIVTCSGGWLVPLGNGQFKCGSTYEWKQLDELPTPEGRATVESIAAKLGSPDFRVLAHEAAIRPILRNSEPLIGPQSNSSWMFNGLGSKGSLYAPGVVRRLADWLLLGIEPEPVLDVRKFINRKPLPHECR